MKDNPLMKYSEQLAVEIESLCKSKDRKIIRPAYINVKKKLNTQLLAKEPIKTLTSLRRVAQTRGFFI